MSGSKQKKYVVVLAHADGWGAMSANKVVKALREKHPDVGVYLIVSTASKNKDGEIITKVEDLRTPRQLKETNLLEFFRRIDERYDGMIPHNEVAQFERTGQWPKNLSPEQQTEYAYRMGMTQAQQAFADQLTFKELAKRYCDDHAVHYTTRGGPKGGEEAGEILNRIEQQVGAKPEVLLSVDTMAIMPERVLNRTQCFSCHPGPLDDVKIEGMQGTLRALTDEVLFDRNGNRLPPDRVFGMGEAYLKGTLFLQHPELDKGPPIQVVQSLIFPGVCAYHAREMIYGALTSTMIEYLPQLLDSEKRAELVKKATAAKDEADKHPHERIPEIDAGRLTKWQGGTVGWTDESQPWGVEVVQNELVNPSHFENGMRCFYPGAQEAFERDFGEVFGAALDKLKAQKRDHLTDSWARLAAGEPGMEITVTRDPLNGGPSETFKNPPPRRG